MKTNYLKRFLPENKQKNISIKTKIKMKTQKEFIQNLINEYEVKISNCKKEVKRYTEIKNSIKVKHDNYPPAYEVDFDYQDMIKDIAVCNAQIQAYVQAKSDIDSILNF